MAFTVNKKAFCVLEFAPKLSQLWLRNRGFGSCTTQNHLQTNQFVNGTWIPAEWLPVRCKTNRPSGPIGPDGLFVSQRTGSHSAGIHVPFTNCFVCRWFCVVHDPKPPLHGHNWLSFGKFQDTERFRILRERHFSSRLPHSGGTWSTPRLLLQKKLGEILYLLICSFLPCLSWLLRSRVRKSRRDFWITLYITMHGLMNVRCSQILLRDTAMSVTWCTSDTVCVTVENFSLVFGILLAQWFFLYPETHTTRVKLSLTIWPWNWTFK